MGVSLFCFLGFRYKNANQAVFAGASLIALFWRAQTVANRQQSCENRDPGPPRAKNAGKLAPDFRISRGKTNAAKLCKTQHLALRELNFPRISVVSTSDKIFANEQR